eukprot:3642791-Rhodomonas_salina.1
MPKIGTVRKDCMSLRGSKLYPEPSNLSPFFHAVAPLYPSNTHLERIRLRAQDWIVSVIDRAGLLADRLFDQVWRAVGRESQVLREHKINDEGTRLGSYGLRVQIERRSTC